MREYWDHLRAVGEPYAVHSEASSSHVPLGLYGDGAKMGAAFATQNIIGVFMNLPLWRPCSIRASRFLLCCISEEQLHKHFTLNAIYRRVVWSCNALWDSRYPDVDQNGDPLTGKEGAQAGKPICAARFAVTEIRGDWSWHKKIFRFPKVSWNGRSMCHMCPAKSVGAWEDRYYNFEGAWNEQMYSLTGFLAHRTPESGPSDKMQ